MINSCAHRANIILQATGANAAAAFMMQDLPFANVTLGTMPEHSNSAFLSHFCCNQIEHWIKYNRECTFNIVIEPRIEIQIITIKIVHGERQYLVEVQFKRDLHT